MWPVREHRGERIGGTASCMAQRIDADEVQSLKNVSDPRYVHTAPDTFVGSGSSMQANALEVIGVVLAAALSVAVLPRLRAGH
jgi:hypothetical protein